MQSRYDNALNESLTKEKIMSRKFFLLIIILTAGLFVGCATLDKALAPLPTLPPTLALPTEIPNTATPWPTAVDSPTPTISPTPRPTRTKLPTATASATVPPITRVQPDNFPDNINPLTGYPPSDPALLERRPIAVKIPNYPHSVRQNQAGLSLADNVFEYHLEEGLTRFIAIFYGNDAERVGPIRSGRIFDVHIVKMYNAVYVFNGAYQEIDNAALDVYGYLVENLNKNLFVVDPGECKPYMCRDESINDYNNLFGNTHEISNLVTERGTGNERPDLVTNAFYSIGNYGNDWAMQVYVNYSYANYAYWEYDLNTGRYLRYQGSADNLHNNPQYDLLIDNLNGQPVAADNVIVLFVPHEFFYKSDTSEIFDIKLTDQGDAYVFRDGKANPAVWVRTDENKPLTIQDTAGNLFPLKPGVTFFQVLTTDSTYTEDNSIWTFDFVRPTPPPE